MSLNLSEPAHKPISSTDEVLLAMIASGDTRGMSRLYDRYSGLVYRIGLHILGEAEAAENLVQNVFLALWRNPDQCLIESTDLATCLAIIASHQARKAILPTHLARESPSNVTVIRQPSTKPHRAVSAGNPIWKAVYALTTAEQLLLELAFLGGMSLEQISTLTGGSLGSVRLQMKNTLIKLRAVARELRSRDAGRSA